jgi:hypothetical protein
MSTTVVGIVGELQHVNELLTAQVEAGMHRDEVMQSLFNSWVARLSAVTKLNDAAKATITNALRSTPFPPDQIKSLAQLILEGNSSGKNKTHNRRPNQKCHYFENYIPEDVWVKLRSGKYSTTSKATLIATAARSVGIELPDQPTLFRMVAIIAWSEAADLTQANTHSLMDKIQSMLQSLPRRTELEFIEIYPASPSDLTVHFHAQYGKHLPPTLDIPELDMVLSGKSMRGRPKTPTKEPEWLKQVPEQYRDSVRQSMQSQSSVSAAISPSLPLPQGSSQARLPMAECLRFKLPAKQLATEDGLGLCAIQDSPLEPKPEGEPRPCNDSERAADTTIEEMEKTYVNATKAKAAAKAAAKAVAKAVAKATAKASATSAASSKTPHVMKRPSVKSSSPSIKKKPAAKKPVAKKPADKKPAGKKPLNMKDIFKQLVFQGNKITRKICTSRAYHAAAKIASKAGKPDNACKVFAREQHAKASKLYDTF